MKENKEKKPSFFKRLFGGTTQETSRSSETQEFSELAQMVEGKAVVIINADSRNERSAYLKMIENKASSFVYLNDSAVLEDKVSSFGDGVKEVRHYDSLPDYNMICNEENIVELCSMMKEQALSKCKTKSQKEQIHELSADQLVEMGLLVKDGENYCATHAFRLLSRHGMKNARVQCACFQGIERDTFIDRKDLTGSLLEQIEQSLQFVLRYLKKGIELEGVYRRQLYEIPVQALREAITNAIVHRDYSDDSWIQVAVFDDRVEISSPGALYGGLDVPAAMSGKSKCRNVSLVEAFCYMGLMDAWGTGLGRIHKSCQEYGLETPLFESSDDSVCITLWRCKQNEMNDSIPVENEDDLQSNQGSESSVELVTKELIQVLKQQPTITQQRLADELGYSKAWIRVLMKNLQDEGILKREGANKKGTWIIEEK